MTWSNLFNDLNGCYSKVGSPQLVTDGDWKGYEITSDGVINFELAQTYKISSNWRCTIGALIDTDMDIDKLSFTVSQFYSLVPLDQVRSKDYEPIVYMKGDEDTFGFFANEVGRADPSYDSGDFDQSFHYMHRFNPNKAYVDYHLSDSFAQNDETRFFQRVTEEVIERINPQLAKVGVPQIRLHAPSGKQSGDLRYNVINLIDEPTSTGLAGYGPSAVNPLTGEIVHAHVNQYSGTLRELSGWFWDRIAIDYNEGRIELVKNPTPAQEEPMATVDNASNTSSSANMTFARIDQQLDITAAEYIAVDKEQLETNDYQSLDTLIRAVEEQLRYPEQEGYTMAELTALQELETRLWQENNMYHVNALRGGATLKTLPTEVGGMVMNFQDPIFWNGEIGKAGNLKEWEELSAEKQEQLSLFLGGVFYAKTLVHELGHNLGLRHNFKGSNDAPNYFTETELEEHGLKTVPGYSSIMDYNPSLLNALAVFGPYDLAALRFGYKRQVEATRAAEGETPAQQVFLDVSEYDEVLLEEATDPYKKPNDLVFDGTIRALEEERTETLREFAFCTDGNVLLNDDCNRFDEGRSRDEIMEYKIETYDDLYAKRAVRGQRENFSETTISSYAFARLNEFMDWRNAIHTYDRYRTVAYGSELSHIQYLAQPFFNEATCSDDAKVGVWPYAVLCGAPTAVDLARDKLVNVLVTPDHTCEIQNAAGEFEYRKLADILGNYGLRLNFPINYVPTSCFDDTVKAALGAELTVVAEVGKMLNSGNAPRPAPVNNYSNYIDYLGYWGDRLAAAATLVDRVGHRPTTDRSTVSLLELPDIFVSSSDGQLRLRYKGDLVLDTIILGTNSWALNFQMEDGTYRRPQGEGFKAFSWDEKIEVMPYSGSYSVRSYFGIPRFESIPFNKAVLNTMVMRSAGVMVDQRDEVFARSITMRSKQPDGAFRTFVRNNGQTYYASAENTYAWQMIGFTGDMKALLDAETNGVDLATVALTTVTLADFQDATKKASMLEQYQYQLQSLENLPIYNDYFSRSVLMNH